MAKKAAGKKKASPAKKQAAKRAAAPSAGHNSGIIPEKAYFKLAREFDSATGAKDIKVGDLRTVRKQMKEQGVDLKAFDFVQRYLKGHTEAELAVFLNNCFTYAKYERVPLVSDLDLFEVEEPTDDTNQKQAFDRGMVAGKRGDSPETNPWTLDNPLGQRWAAGHQEGKEALLGAGISKLDPEGESAQKH
jgi:hypothetical protein